MNRSLRWIAGVTVAVGIAGLVYAAPALADSISYRMGYGRSITAAGNGTPGAGPGYGMMQGYNGNMGAMHETMLPIMQQMPAIQAAVMGDVAAKLGMTLDELTAAYQKGETLATLAAAKQIGLDEIKATMTDSMKAQLDKLVAEKSLTTEQAQQVLDLMATWIDNCVTGNYYGMMGGGMMGGGRGFRGGAAPGAGN